VKDKTPSGGWDYESNRKGSKTSQKLLGVEKGGCGSKRKNGKIFLHDLAHLGTWVFNLWSGVE
jgi:hypothetical protein